MDEKMIALANMIAARLKQLPPAKPALKLVVPESARPPSLLTDEARAAHLRRIQFVAGRYGIWWLVDQELDGVSVDDLADEHLVRVRLVMEKALKCILEGVSFEDAELVRWAC